MSEVGKSETEVKGPVNSGMDSSVKTLPSSAGNDGGGIPGQVVISATTTTQAEAPCQNENLTHDNDVSANITEDMHQNNNFGSENNTDCGVVQQEGQKNSDNVSVDSKASEMDQTSSLAAETENNPAVTGSVTEVSAEKIGSDTNDDTAQTTSASDQEQSSPSSEQNDLSVVGDLSEQFQSGLTLNHGETPGSMENDGDLTQKTVAETEVATKSTEDLDKTISAKEKSVPEEGSVPPKDASFCGSTAEHVTSDASRPANQNTAVSKVLDTETGEQLMVNLPPVESLTEAAAGESACASAPDEDCGATAAAAPSAPGASATPSSSKQSSQDRGQSTGAVSPDDPNSAPSVYSVKWVLFKNNKVPVITQNENGPCPLIAIMNVLLLQKKIQFPTLMEMVTSDQLMSYLGECIFENAPKNITEDSRLNYEQNMQDAMAVFHKLQTGLDVNVRFTGVCDFEYTPECIIFDLLEIRLYHGWLVDPQEPQVGTAVGNCSYNQLVEKIIAQKSSDKQELVTEALNAETFLESSASQLTYHGLCELSTSVKEGQLCVFFRNNHFSTLYKHKGELFILVTDQGFLTECNVVWETLSNVEGDCHFVDANFHTYTKPELAPLVPSDIPAGSDQQIDQDYLVALSLQQEQQLTVDQEAGWNPQLPQQQPPPQPGAPAVPLAQLSDHELAMRLQEEEDRRAAAAYQQQQQQQPAPAQQPRSPGSQSSSSSGGRRPRDRDRERRDKEKEKDSCVVL